MIRRARGFAACGLIIALVLPGCRAYDARYWSFPLNSMEMVDDAVVTPRPFGDALGHEFLLQLFPWSWIVSAVDILMLPITLPYDFVEMTIRRDEPYPFEAQVHARRHQGVERPRASQDRVRGPQLNPGRGAEHLEPAEH